MSVEAVEVVVGGGGIPGTVSVVGVAGVPGTVEDVRGAAHEGHPGRGAEGWL